MLLGGFESSMDNKAWLQDGMWKMPHIIVVGLDSLYGGFKALNITRESVRHKIVTNVECTLLTSNIIFFNLLVFVSLTLAF